ncbi:hypothetical protein FHL15_010938 [Xylaria flabelliformis]|uniref:Uncharacterized protein n=1 Tax=Xylaria flabelliformis TaxID=2512241 RepID=A0A553HJR0_9PEZI|nr:hypothetical protein FHL15_010938 [Xylaria flabelliformis]
MTLLEDLNCSINVTMIFVITITPDTQRSLVCQNNVAASGFFTGLLPTRSSADQDWCHNALVVSLLAAIIGSLVDAADKTNLNGVAVSFAVACHGNEQGNR